MWFIGVEVKQETSAPLLKKSWICPCDDDDDDDDDDNDDGDDDDGY